MQKPVVPEAETRRPTVRCALVEQEKLLRLRANRRGRAIDLRVHFEISFQDGCRFYRIITVDEVD